jgi:hypothetical protein
MERWANSRQLILTPDEQRESDQTRGQKYDDRRYFHGAPFRRQ